MVSDDPESFADLDGHCDPGLDCLKANLEGGARQIANSYEQAAKAVVTVVKDTVNGLGAGVGEVVGGLASGNGDEVNDGAAKITLAVVPFLADAPEAGVEESGIEANRASGLAFEGKALENEGLTKNTAPPWKL